MERVYINHRRRREQRCNNLDDHCIMQSQHMQSLLRDYFIMGRAKQASGGDYAARRQEMVGSMYEFVSSCQIKSMSVMLSKTISKLCPIYRPI